MARPRGFLLSAPAFRALTTAKGITQRDVAARSELSTQTISALYRQTTRASAPTAHAVARAIAVEAEALFPEMSGQFVVAEDLEAVS